jgi:4-hydroxybenzoate-CoA ligase
MEFPRDYNAATDFIDRHVAAGRGDHAAFIDHQRTITYSGLAAESRKAADMLTRGLGLRREDRVALLLLDTVDYPVLFWGAIRAGVVPVLLNTLLAPPQYRYMLADSRARVLVVSAQLLPAVESILADTAIDKVVVAGGEAGAHLALPALLEAANGDFTTAPTVGDEVAFWLYSSGSTGDPKGAMHIHSSLMQTALTYGNQVLGIRPDDVVFSAAKIFFAYGLGNSVTFPMAVGATTVLMAGRPTPDAVFEVMKASQPTLFFGVPTLYAAMLAAPQCTPQNGSQKLRLCVSAGEALPEEVGKTWKARFGVDIIDGVGSTEMLHIFLSNAPDDVRYGTQGKAVPGYDLRLIGEDGAGVGDGEIGELLVDGLSSSIGYWNQRTKSRSTFEGCWTRTGDKFYRDAEGYYHICGRTDDMFKVSGIWVSPFEVEAALISHPAVLEAGVVAQEDEDGLTKPKAFVILKDGASRDGLYDELKEHVKVKIGKWKYPRWIEFVETLPKTATGKIQRFKLRSPR